MPLYDLDAVHHANTNQLPFPDAKTLERLWQLFVAIGDFWQNNPEPERMRSNFLVFVANRIKVECCYVDEYNNAAHVLDELIAELGAPAGFEKLLTDVQADVAPPTTRLARARQRVSNEFVALQMALGGFKAFGAANYLGYVAGANIEGHVPYRPLDGVGDRSP